MTWSKKNIALIALGIILILALVLPLTDVLADPYKFLTDKEGQKNQTTQKMEETTPPSGEMPAANNNNSTPANQLNDYSTPVDNGVTPPTATNGQPVTTVQPAQQVQDTPKPGSTTQPSQNTQPNPMFQPGPGYYPRWDCAPMAAIPPDYQPNYEWYDNGNSWEGRTRGHW